MGYECYAAECPECNAKESLEICEEEKYSRMGDCLECGWSFTTEYNQLTLKEVNNLREDIDPITYPPLKKLKLSKSNNSYVYEEQDLVDYLAKFDNYPLVLYRECPDCFKVVITDLQGCISEGKTLEEAMNSIREAYENWIRTNLEQGEIIPDPSAVVIHINNNEVTI